MYPCVFDLCVRWFFCPYGGNAAIYITFWSSCRRVLSHYLFDIQMHQGQCMLVGSSLFNWLTWICTSQVLQPAIRFPSWGVFSGFEYAWWFFIADRIHEKCFNLDLKLEWATAEWRFESILLACCSPWCTRNIRELAVFVQKAKRQLACWLCSIVGYEPSVKSLSTRIQLILSLYQL